MPELAFSQDVRVNNTELEKYFSDVPLFPFIVIKKLLFQ